MAMTSKMTSRTQLLSQISIERMARHRFRWFKLDVARVLLDNGVLGEGVAVVVAARVLGRVHRRVVAICNSELVSQQKAAHLRGLLLQGTDFDGMSGCVQFSTFGGDGL
jgi:hypothetical protein